CRFFFSQAEDGIRDFHVTGVQTCALPISAGMRAGREPAKHGVGAVVIEAHAVDDAPVAFKPEYAGTGIAGLRSWRHRTDFDEARSEERRVGKEWWYRGMVTR